MIEWIAYAVIYLTVLILFVAMGLVWIRFSNHRKDLGPLVFGIALLAFVYTFVLIEQAAGATTLPRSLAAAVHAFGIAAFGVGLIRWTRRSVRLIGHLERLATLDELTRVPNRRGFSEAVEGFFARGAAATPFYLFLVDLNGFKEVNDRFGHDRGDILLRDLAQDLKALAEPNGVCGRLGGDEFTLAIPADQVENLDGFVARVQERVRLQGERSTSELGASVGYAAYPMDGPTLPDLLRVADLRMYRVKRAGATR